jgi:hypothetical protein
MVLVCRAQILMKGRNLLISFLCSVVLFASIALADKFESADSNHDGLLDRQEYDTLIHELKETIDPFLNTKHEAMIPQVFSVADWFSSAFQGTMAEDFVSGIFNSLVVIWVTEIGDKTFFIAAVLAMRNGRTLVYLGCMGRNFVFSSAHSRSSVSCLGCDACALMPHGICAPLPSAKGLYTLCECGTLVILFFFLFFLHPSY